MSVVCVCLAYDSSIVTTCPSIPAPTLLFVGSRFAFRLCFCCLLFFCLGNQKQNQGRGLIDCKLVQAPPSNFIAGRPKAALLFWFFGDLDVACCYLWLVSLDINVEIGKHSC